MQIFIYQKKATKGSGKVPKYYIYKIMMDEIV